MDYAKHYDRLIRRAKGRVIDGYTERHHIVPRCRGGSDDSENIVRLTPEEHYIAHLLLVKMYPGDHRLLWAAMNMTAGNSRQTARQGNKAYGWLRRRFATEIAGRNRGRKASPETRAKMSEARRKRVMKPHSAETRAKMSAAKVGRKFTEEHRAKLAAAKLGKTRAPHPEERRRRISESNKATHAGRDQSVYRTDEYRRKQSEISKAAWARRKLEK